MKILTLILSLAGVTPADNGADKNPTTAILNTIGHDQHPVLLEFGKATTDDEIDHLADDLRAKGYVLDEQAALLNPRVIKVLHHGRS